MAAASPAPRDAAGPAPSARAEALAALACLAAALALTWPLAARFSSWLGADAGDAPQTVWTWRWLHDALVSGRNPFFSERVFHPHGASLVFQTLDLPTALLVAPLWSFLDVFAVHNAGVLFAFWLTAFGMYRLAARLTGDRVVAVCAGVLFCATPYHMAHALGHQHLVSAGWLPLYFAQLLTLLAGRARLRDAALGGVWLGLATLASGYHLLFALAATPVLLGAAAWTRRLELRPLAARAAVLAAAFALVAGPWLAAVLAERAKEPLLGAHDAIEFSGDLEAFLFPNEAQRWSGEGGRARLWSGNRAENALYPGWILLVLAGLAAARRERWARAWVAVALVGAVLALGPRLHVGGRVLVGVELPYGWLERAFPILQFAGVPVRFGYLLYLGLVAAAASGLAGLRARAAGPKAQAALALVPLLALVELGPRPLLTTPLPVPPVFREWARTPDASVVLDLSGPSEMMWHGALHRQKMLGGYFTRVPERLARGWTAEPIVSRLLDAESRPPVRVERVEPRLAFDWKDGAPWEELWEDRFAAVWRGRLLVPESGEWRLFLLADEVATLALDGRAILLADGRPGPERSVALELAAGPHELAVHYRDLAGAAAVRLEWQGPGRPREIVPAAALRTRQGEPGLEAAYYQLPAVCGLPPEAGRAALRRLGVRHVIVGRYENPCVSKELALPLVWEGGDVRVYEVPGDGP